jgi:glycogen debranching enzyme
MIADDPLDPYHVVVSRSITASGVRVLKHDDTFAVFNRFGDVHAIQLGEQGLYHRGTRFLSRLRLSVGGSPLLLLSSTVLQNNLLFAIDLTNPDLRSEDGQTLVAPYGTLHVFRSKFLGDAVCYERLQVSNYGPRAIDALIQVEFANDFVDVFEVRGTRRERRGETLDPRLEPGAVQLAYRGLDQLVRTTRLDFAPAPESLTAQAASFRIHLEVKQTRDIYIWTTCLSGEEHRPVQAYEAAFSRSLRQAERAPTTISTANTQFNEWLDRSRADLRMMITETPEGPFPYAGVPWFSTPFGRDSIWTAIEVLWFKPALAAGVLRFLAATQARERNDDVDAEPGKVIHEMRDGEMAALGEIPLGRYYGSIDATPLYLILAALYHERTADLALIRSLWPSLLAALDWMDKWGDSDGDGFIEYQRRSRNGLLQQGWKDSRDSVFHHDGTMADAPIALGEVQGYAYAARLGMARLSRLLGEAGRARQLEQQAQELRQRFDAAFWCEELGTYALALDGKKLPCRVRSSNAGHCLYTGIALPQRVHRLATSLMTDEMFSGWGIRTLAANEQHYNPMSYHNGSIWPHDNAIVAAGLARAGYREWAVQILNGLFEASLFVELHRLPELFCGFPRRANQGPTLYPVACSPQAWAAAAPFMILQSVLGLRIDAGERRVTFEHPVLPASLQDVTIRNLRVGDAEVDLRLHRYPEDVGINVLRKEHDLEVVLVR